MVQLARHVADRLTPSHVPDHNVYAHGFPGVATKAFLDIRFGQPEEDVHTVYGYSIPKNLFGHPIDSCFYLFDNIPIMFSAITEGKLEADILEAFEEIRRNAAERLDSLNPERTSYRAARSGRIFERDELEFVDFPSTPIDVIASMDVMPQLLFLHDISGFRNREATHFVPFGYDNPGCLPLVAWAKPRE